MIGVTIPGPGAGVTGAPAPVDGRMSRPDGAGKAAGNDCCGAGAGERSTTKPTGHRHKGRGAAAGQPGERDRKPGGGHQLTCAAPRFRVIFRCRTAPAAISVVDNVKPRAFGAQLVRLAVKDVPCLTPDQFCHRGYCPPDLSRRFNVKVSELRRCLVVLLGIADLVGQPFRGSL